MFSLCTNNCTTYFSFSIGIVRVDNSSGRNIGILQVTLFPFERRQLFQPGCWDRCLLPPLVCRSDVQCCVLVVWFRRTSLWSIWVLFAGSSVHTDLQCWPYFFLRSGVLDFFMLKFHSHWWLLTSLDVSAVSVHWLQAVRMPLVAGATFTLCNRPTSWFLCHLLHLLKYTGWCPVYLS